MLERLGHVLGWTGNIIGGLFVAGGVGLLLFGGDRFGAIFLLLLPGIVIFLLGRAMREPD